MVTHEDAVARARDVAEAVLAPAAGALDKEGRFPEDGVRALGKSGLLGLMIPTDVGGAGLGVRTFAEVTAILAASDASAAMVYVMHTSAVATLVAAPRTPVVAETLREIAAGRHLTTLALSERGSRSHFWAPVSQAAASPEEAGVRISAEKSWVTSAGNAQSYVVTTRAAGATGALDTTLYLVPADAPGVRVASPWDGMGLRANDSAAVTLENVLVPDERRVTAEGAGMTAKLSVVLPVFNLGCAAMSLGVCRAAVGATSAHLKAATFEHQGGVPIGEALPGLRARLAAMHVETEGLAARVEGLVRALEKPDPMTPLVVLAAKAAANEAAIRVTGEAMRACGGAAFSRRIPVERHFRDAHAGAVMAPTVEQSHEFIGRALLGMPLL